MNRRLYIIIDRTNIKDKVLVKKINKVIDKKTKSFNLGRFEHGENVEVQVVNGIPRWDYNGIIVSFDNVPADTNEWIIVDILEKITNILKLDKESEVGYRYEGNKYLTFKLKDIDKYNKGGECEYLTSRERMGFGLV